MGDKQAYFPRVAAAAFSSGFAAAVVNPLDVLKTRMQVQAVAPSSNAVHFCVDTMSLPLREIAWGPSWPLVCSRVPSCAHRSPSLSSLASPPGWSPATHTFPLSRNRPNMLTTLNAIVRMEGVGALWKGLSTSMLVSIPLVGIYMPMYDNLHAELRGDLGVYAPSVAGMAARAIAVIATAPLELLRTRQQATPAVAARPSTSLLPVVATSPQSAARPAILQGAPTGSDSRERGSVAASQSRLGASLSQVRCMWTGVGATLARDVPFTALYWCAVECVRGHLLSPSLRGGTAASTVSKGQGHSARPAHAAAPASSPPDSISLDGPSPSRVLCVNLAAGGVSGGLAAMATTPFDVVKTRLQTMARHEAHTVVDVLNRTGSMPGPTGCGRPAAAAAFAYKAKPQAPTSTLGMLRSIWLAEGVRGLFSGVGPRAARAAPACAIVIASYEVLKTAM